jgi:hypothetical protein
MPEVGAGTVYPAIEENTVLLKAPVKKDAVLENGPDPARYAQPVLGRLVAPVKPK